MEETWIIRVAKVSLECPFKDNEDPLKCHHSGNKSSICKRDNCKIRVTTNG